MTESLEPRHEAPVKTIAFVQYLGLTPLDIVGPLQVFSVLSQLVPGYRTVVVGERIEPMPTDTPLSLVPSHTFETMPDPHMLIVPGGTVPTLAAMADERLLDKLRTAAARSRGDQSGGPVGGAHHPVGAADRGRQRAAAGDSLRRGGDGRN